MDYATDMHWRNAGRAHARETAGARAHELASRLRPRQPAALAMHAMAVEFPHVHAHPNRLPFEGVLTLVDVASDRAPSGARGHRVVLTRAAAEAALPSLLGMAVDYKAGWDGHDARQKCGIITSAELDGRRLTVAGFVFSRDFPEIEQRLNASSANRPATACHPERSEGSPHLSSGPSHRSPIAADPSNVMGMSYELADAHVADMSASVWTLTRATFTGAAILLRDKAAYRDTSFRLRSTKLGAPCSTRSHRVDRGVTAKSGAPS
jgi:hypothetical protein